MKKNGTVSDRTISLRNFGGIRRLFSIILVLLFLLSACQTAQPIPAPTIFVLPTQAPPPTATATEVNLQATQWVLETAQAPATQTQQAREAEATQFVLKVTEDAIASATAALNAPVLAELPAYGVDSTSGYVAWMHKPVTVSSNGFHVFESVNDYADLSVKDFVLAADINWDTQYGISGCGFSLRSDGNKEAPNQYMIVFTRSTDGHIFFNALSKGKVANYKDFYANVLDPELDWENGATNHIAIVVRGNNIKIYSHKILVGEVNLSDPPPQQPVLPVKPVKPAPPSSDLSGDDLKEAKKAYQQALEEYQEDISKYDEQVTKITKEHAAVLNAYRSMEGVYEEGFVGLLAYSSAGYSNCEFNNAWLWVIQ